MFNNETFKRNQVETALWQVFSRNTRAATPASSTFLTRIKRLLDVDRKFKENSVPDAPDAAAFVDEQPGKGTHSTFSGFNAFCLAIGLDLMDLGFNQRDVVFLLKFIRPDLEKQYAWIMNNPPIPRQQLAAEDRPNCPHLDEDGFRIADCRVYMLLTKVEFKEVFGNADQDNPMIFAPTFCCGVNAVREALHTRSYELPKLVVLEIAHRAVMVSKAIAMVPAAIRGRPANS
jgi:hypothetical protein